MKYLIYPLIIFLFLLTISSLSPSRTKQSNKYEYWQMEARTDYENSKCINDELCFEVKVNFEELEGNTIGLWKPGSETIVLEETDIDTISHEVYHMTQYIGEKYNLHDREGEYLAYLEGYFTKCVSDLVKKRLSIN